MLLKNYNNKENTSKTHATYELVAVVLMTLLLPGCASSGRTVRAGDAAASAPASPSAIDSREVAMARPVEAASEPGGPSMQRARNRGAVALESQAMSEFSAGDRERAAATLERAIRLDPNDSALWVALGDVRLAQGRPELAESLGMKAEALASGDPERLSAARRLLVKARRAQ
jgi:tetratricopeptide (TPR) repeat protein